MLVDVIAGVGAGEKESNANAKKKITVIGSINPNTLTMSLDDGAGDGWADGDRSWVEFSDSQASGIDHLQSMRNLASAGRP